MRRTVCLLLLLVIATTATVSAQGGISSCCRYLSNTRVHRDSLESYYRQHRQSCMIHAVVFKTVKKRRICADPESLWTKTSMAYLDGKHRMAFLLQNNSQQRLLETLQRVN